VIIEREGDREHRAHEAVREDDRHSRDRGEKDEKMDRHD
jgi:hypothetical protein